MANPYSRRTVLRDEIPSAALGKTRPIRIFLPPGFNGMEPLRIVYCQDGEECFNFGRIATHAARLIAEEGLEPFLIVGVDVDMPNRSAEYSPAGERFGPYSQFFLRELLPYVESRYPVRTGPGDRILVGDSRGAAASLHLSLQVPDLIQKVISLSGAFLEPTRRVLENGADLSWLKLYQLIGTEETAVETTEGIFDFLEWNRRLHPLFVECGAEVCYVEKPGKHTWGFWQQELPDALRWALSD